ncbi:conserved hypothetical protein [Aspergillus terreus NIH2624]|uniref:Zn(2)-C6 fungal-type domain-containing protein n=1 Tax=Aspergillus terreus (strain NIH 2624 / FGSC A1156) TaxID=341663 RepID=Q0CN25_ASPTN|nr:uncharacterized protein ATEG_04909 [Aspergillus terreus NIH2624]EAU35356.1 conserved hypothetical protein [Aspergillus terreus NIH2624]
MESAQPGETQPSAQGPSDDPTTATTTTATTVAGTTPPPKRRWRRNRIACDSCHSRRVRCDRAFPCSRCLRSDIRCEFTRERRKRGRIARSRQTENTGTAGAITTEKTTATTATKPLPPSIESVLTPIAQHESPSSTFPHRSPATNEMTASAASVDGRRSQAEISLPPPQPRRSVPDGNNNATEEWLSGTHVSPGSYEFLGGGGLGDGPFPRMFDVWNGVDLAGYGAPTPRGNKPSSIGQPPPVALKYPVLQPLMPFLDANMPRRLVFDLLELYFTSAFSTHMHPVCHHIHCYVLRKASFLSRDNPRPSSPALLARDWSVRPDLSMMLLPISMSPRSFSSSEQKAASMRWWHAAFTLARELKLNQEIEVMPSVDSHPEGSSPSFDYSLPGWSGVDTGPLFDYSNPTRPSLNCVCDRGHDAHNTITEEHREERRRTWWLLYIMDRHLALCYNRPLALLDAESEDLLLPLDEGSWQGGNIHSNSPKPDGPQCPLSGDKNKRRVFPNFICHDHSIFGFFLPLMTMTGELIDLNQARNHPMLGVRLHGKDAWDVHVSEVLRQLEIYKASLTTFAATASDPEAPFSTAYPAPKPDHPVDPALAQAYSWHTQTVISYASYLVHVLHILLVGKWDPVSLIEDKDFWTSSPAFASTISHALDAADSVNQILRFDPDISFMPYFFGIQLLQGSFLLLLIVERLQKEAGEGILNACEVMIRATESCVVTLNTEYQRNFRQVMRSAVAQARGRPVNHSEIRHRRKAVLALYRWTRKGTGLAL